MTDYDTYRGGDHDDYDDPADYDYDPRDDYDDYPQDEYDPWYGYDEAADYDPRDYGDEDPEDEDPEDPITELANYLKSLTVGNEYRRYGYFQCKNSECAGKNRWQSANVYCEYEGDGAFKPLYSQACRDCKVMTLPHKNEKLKKPDGVTHDVEKRHLAELCERCKSGKHCRRA